MGNNEQFVKEMLEVTPSNFVTHKYNCSKHGDVTDVITSKLIDLEGVFCMHCAMEKLIASGVRRVTEVETNE